MRKLRKQLIKLGVEPETVNEMIKNIKKLGNPFGEVKTRTPDKLYCC